MVDQPGHWIMVGQGMTGESLIRFPLEGRTTVTHLDGRVVNEAELTLLGRDRVSIRSRYELTPTSQPGKLDFFQENPSLGGLRGEMADLEDRLVITYRSADGSVTGAEVLLRMGEKRYSVTGVITLEGRIHSLWAGDMVRVEEGKS